jgi:hypothetical protein
MKRLLVVAGLALVVAASASAAGSPYTAKRTAACLTAHKVLTAPDRVKQILPPGLKAVEALSLGFAMIPAQATDRAELLFAGNPRGAKTLAAGWIRYAIEQASHVQGINQADAARRIRSSVSVQGNAVVSWGVEHPKLASKRLVVRASSSKPPSNSGLSLL